MASRNISISLPEEMIQQANQLASREQRTVSELFREAFRLYRSQQVKKWADEPTQHDFKGQELTRISQQIRAELETEHLTSDPDAETP